MISLCMDTSYQQLVVGIYQDHTLLAGVSKTAFKKQSESIFVELHACLEKANLDYKDIDRIVITDGPGSYTGIRIAMTIAKVLCSQLHIDLYCISTMQLYAGLQESANVILDARSQRAYCGYLSHGQHQEEMKILEVNQLPEWIQSHPGTILGDAHLVQEPEQEVDFLQNFIDLEPVYRKIENIHALVPQYLKESDAYKA